MKVTACTLASLPTIASNTKPVMHSRGNSAHSTGPACKGASPRGRKQTAV